LKALFSSATDIEVTGEVASGEAIFSPGIASRMIDFFSN
jgi:hypothetical protein